DTTLLMLAYIESALANAPISNHRRSPTEKEPSFGSETNGGCKRTIRQRDGETKTAKLWTNTSTTTKAVNVSLIEQRRLKTNRSAEIRSDEFVFVVKIDLNRKNTTLFSFLMFAYRILFGQRANIEAS
ncbi:Hypothetical predicted protein, partial [Paramuricea clavata]